MKIKIFTGILVVMALGCGDFAWACLSKPQVYDLADGLSIELTANTSVIFKGRKIAPNVVKIQTVDGEDFLFLKVTQGVHRWEDQRNVFQRMMNLSPFGPSEVFKKDWTQIDIANYEGLKFPLELTLRIQGDGKEYNVKILYTVPVLEKCT